MINHKVVAGLCCVVMLAMSGCSRQQSDWQKTRESNTTESYEQFLKKYPSGEFTTQAQARVKELYEERDWQKARDADTPEAYQAFLKQYPEGKWTEEARIRVENFTLAQAPSGSGAPVTAAGAALGVQGDGSSGSPPGGSPPGGSPSGGSPAGRSPTAAAITGPAPPAGATHATSVTARGAADGAVSAGGAGAAAGAASRTALTKNSKAATGKFSVQLGAFKSGASAAHARWTHLQKEFPAALSGLSSKVSTKHTASGSLYRLQAMGLSEKHARSICASLAAKSQPCLVVAPDHG